MSKLNKCIAAVFMCIWLFLGWSLVDFLKQNWNFYFFKWSHWRFLWDEMQQGSKLDSSTSSFFFILFLALIINIIILGFIIILFKKAHFFNRGKYLLKHHAPFPTAKKPQPQARPKKIQTSGLEFPSDKKPKLQKPRKMSSSPSRHLEL